MKAKLFLDLGAYFQFFTPMIPSFTGLLMHGAYKVPAISFEQIAVFTNKRLSGNFLGL